ncbi:hypothetical protein [Enterobacter ludwigii]|jgi:hypothetical protein|uniref:hypothetical protein n=1 Tax=Enterobacter ludwigii TaxID=299767 RepID=UPI000ABFF115
MKIISRMPIIQTQLSCHREYISAKYDGTTREHALNTEGDPETDGVAKLLEELIPAIIDVEEQYGRTWNIHPVNCWRSKERYITHHHNITRKVCRPNCR